MPAIDQQHTVAGAQRAPADQPVLLVIEQQCQRTGSHHDEFLRTIYDPLLSLMLMGTNSRARIIKIDPKLQGGLWGGEKVVFFAGEILTNDKR